MRQYAYDYHIIDFRTGVREAIDEQTFDKLKDESQIDNAVRYESVKNGKKIKLFSVYQYHDLPWENPKPKYNGIYINDGKNNIRISRLDGYALLKSKPVWVENDTKVIIGHYLLDVEGEQKEAPLIDGEMLYAVQVKPQQ